MEELEDATSKISEAKIKAYWNHLSDLNMDVLEKAVGRMLKTRERSTFPSIGEIRNAIHRSDYGDTLGRVRYGAHAQKMAWLREHYNRERHVELGQSFPLSGCEFHCFQKFIYLIEEDGTESVADCPHCRPRGTGPVRDIRTVLGGYQTPEHGDVDVPEWVKVGDTDLKQKQLPKGDRR